jgi:hypothetical protein
MAEMNRFLRMCLLSFAALTVSMGTANGQTRDSARISLSHRTLDGLATTFNDYAGFAYTAADLQQLQEQASLLESSGHQAFLKIAHIVLSPYGQINEELEGQALSKLLGDKELLFYVYFASADLPPAGFFGSRRQFRYDGRRDFRDRRILGCRDAVAQRGRGFDARCAGPRHQAIPDDGG